MALQINYNVNIEYETTQNIDILKQIDSTITNTTSKSIVINNSYIKINNFTGDKDKITIYVGMYDKKDGTMIMSKNYDFIPNISDSSSNFIKQGYEYLKTLDEFKSATDLLDEEQQTATQ